MDHVNVLFDSLDGFVFLQFFRESRYISDDSPIKIDVKSTLEEHLVVLGNNTCVSIVEVLGIGRRFPGKCCCLLICFLTENGSRSSRNAIEPRARATIEFGIADATLPPEEPSLTSCSVAVPAVTVVVVSAIVIPPVTIVIMLAIVEPPVAVVVVSAVVVLLVAVVMPTVKLSCCLSTQGSANALK
jgi:hypothetical protein